MILNIDSKQETTQRINRSEGNFKEVDYKTLAVLPIPVKISWKSIRITFSLQEYESNRKVR